ncbi:MAG: RNA polymerase sigma factor RpoH [Nevskia sp.]|nr:RNA polymerase sigma factor RpoH [Nevskia sp.]
MRETASAVNDAVAVRKPLPTLPSPLGSDGVDAYLRAIGRVPLLDAGEEARLARRLHAQQDVGAAQTLVLSNLRFVVHIARGYAGYRLPLADLIQEGNVGLMKAVRRFDPAMGVRLISFAVHWIKSAIHEFILRNWKIIRVGTTKAQRKLFFNLRRYQRHLGWLSRAEADAIAADLRVPVEEVMQMEARMAAAEIPLGPVSAEPDAAAFEDQLADQHDEIAALEEQDWTRWNAARMRAALATLDPRSRDIIRRRWLTDGAQAGLQSLADEYGVSAERIRQIQERALSALRSSMERPPQLPRVDLPPHNVAVSAPVCLT